MNGFRPKESGAVRLFAFWPAAPEPSARPALQPAETRSTLPAHLKMIVPQEVNLSVVSTRKFEPDAWRSA